MKKTDIYIYKKKKIFIVRENNTPEAEQLSYHENRQEKGAWKGSWYFEQKRKTIESDTEDYTMGIR